MLPGLGDGLRTVKGTALVMAWMYRALAKNYTVYMFSRKNDLAVNTSTRDMAKDLQEAMSSLGIQKADVVGVSMGGMIAQWLAIDYPCLINRLVLVATCAEPNSILNESIDEWNDYLDQGNYQAFMDSNLRRIYSASYYRKNRWTIPLVSKLTKPKSYERFKIMAEACKQHDSVRYLRQISAPTLVIGGERDIAIGTNASYEIASSIPGAQLKMYPQWGHGLYEEAPDFLDTVLNYLRED